MKYLVYILKCSDGKYYTGCTSDLETRLKEHQEGMSDFTSRRLPVELVYSQSFQYVNEAISAERRLKGWSKKKKEALIKNDFDLLHQLAKCTNDTSHENR